MDGHEVVVAEEDVQLSAAQPPRPPGHDREMQDEEHVAGPAVDLGALGLADQILEVERVKPEPLLEQHQLGRAGPLDHQPAERAVPELLDPAGRAGDL